MNKALITNYLNEHKAEMSKFFEALVRMEAPTNDKEGLTKLATYISAYAKSMGLVVTEYPFPKAGPTLVIQTPPTELAPVLLCSHMDTVHAVGVFGEDAFVRDAENPDIIHGPGTYDTKGGIVIALYTLLALKELGYQQRQLKLVLVGDEENAHGASEGGSAAIIEQEAKGCVCCFNCDSGRLNNRIVLQRNGGGVIKVIIKGKAAHAGNNPWDGANAIHAAAEKISAIRALSDYNDAYFGTGVIQGGSKSNIVPDYCEFVNDIRFKTNQAYDRAIENIRKIVETNDDPKIQAELKIVGIFRAMEKTPKSDVLLELFSNAAEELGYPRLEGVFAGGCSDAAYVTNLGVPTLCGTGILGENAHTLQEYAIESSMQEQISKVALTIIRLPDEF